MLVGVVSDTHMNKEYIKKAALSLKKCKIIIHLGDNTEDVNELKKYYSGKIVYVRGNCDYGEDVPSETIAIIENKKFFITHGHHYNVKATLLNLKYKAREVGADIVLFGHTHIALSEFDDEIWFINPGSASLPRNKKNSVAIIDISDNIVHPIIKNI